MKFEIGGTPYSIEFKYDKQVCRSGLAETTTCNIRLCVTGEDNPVATGTVARYYKDKPDRDLARKAALGRALVGFLSYLDPPETEDRAIRTAAWKAYINRKVK